MSGKSYIKISSFPENRVCSFLQHGAYSLCDTARDDAAREIKMKKLVAAATIIMCTAPAFAVTGFLQSESINGGLKYCYYSNGAILTVASHSLCPMSVN